VGIRMSIELPEAKILAEQMNGELRGKHIKSYCLRNYEKLQKGLSIETSSLSINL
jgi:hypothetical protein